MLVSKLITSTLALQGFRVESVVKRDGELVARVVPDKRYRPLCSHCGGHGRHRDTRGDRQFRHVPLWGIAVVLLYAPRRISWSEIRHWDEFDFRGQR